MKINISHSNIRRMAVAAMATVILAGCSSSDEPSAMSPLFIEAYSPAQSRANTPLENTYPDFGVWVWKTNADHTQSLVIGRKPTAEAQSEYYTRKVGSGWSYEYVDNSASPAITQYLRYWDRAALSYHFAAYSPYYKGGVAVNTLYEITATPYGVNISSIIGNIPESEAIDWIESRWQRQIETTLIDIDRFIGNGVDHRINSLESTVPLIFHHILAGIEFRAYTESTEDIKVSKLSISFSDAEAIATKGNYSGGILTPVPGQTATNIYNLPSELNLTGHDADHYVSLTSLLQLPQSVIGRKFNIAVTLSDGSEFNGAFEIKEGWDSEKRYIYYICINPNAKVILLDFTCDDWDKGEDIVVGQPIENW